MVVVNRTVIDNVVWNVDVPENLDSFEELGTSTRVTYKIPDVKSDLEIWGEINCSGTNKRIYGDTKPIEFVSDLTVELRIDENTYVITNWIPEDVVWTDNGDAIINHLNQYCLSSTPDP